MALEWGPPEIEENPPEWVNRAFDMLLRADRLSRICDPDTGKPLNQKPDEQATAVDECAVRWEAIRLHAHNCVAAATATASRLPGSTVPTIGHTAAAHLDEARQQLTQGKAV